MDNTKTSSISFCGLLTLAFIVLKLCNVINWSWLWVLAPVWIPSAIVLVSFIIFAIIAIITKYLT